MNKKRNLAKVSIIIPVYNGSNYLKNAIDSALAQTYPNLEILVVNDGSSDAGTTERIALSYGDKIRYFSKPNGGVSSALNYGIAQMTGDYFSWLSHDDMYAPEKVEDAVTLLGSISGDKRRTIAYTSGHFVDKDGKWLRSFSYKFPPGKQYTGREMAAYACSHSTLNGCCMLIPREAFEEFGGFDESLRYRQDALMWLTLFLGGYGLISDNKDNVRNRLHGSQVSRNRRDLFELDSMAIARKLAPDLAKNSSQKVNLLYLQAMRMAKYNCPEVVRYYRDFAADHCPFTLKQQLRLRLQCLYGKGRGQLKNIYDRYILKIGT